MVWTIAPAVSGQARRRVMGMHSAGLIAGAFAMACVVLLIGGAVRWSGVADAPAVKIGAAIVLVGWAVQATGRRGLPFPRSRWQVPEQWRATLPLSATALFYGFLLGLGPLTDVVLPAYWLLVGATLMTDHVVVALFAWVSYALIRTVVTAGGIADYADSCGIDGAPSTRIRPNYERRVAQAATVVLCLTVAVTMATSSMSA